MEQTEDPRRGLDWLYRRGIAQQLVADFLHGRVPIGHAALDTVNRSRSKRSPSVEHLRYLLVASEVLPHRDEHMHRLEEAVDRMLADTDPSRAAVLRQWAIWKVLPRARRRAKSGQVSAGAAAEAKTKVTVVHHFLSWLNAKKSALRGLSQTEVDHWIALHSRYRVVMTTFLSWAGRRGHAPRGWSVAAPTKKAPKRFIDPGELYAVARTCLTDTTIPAGIRLAACLILLYGQPLNRICRLKADDLHHDEDGATSIQLGRTPLRLPPAIAGLAHEAAQTASEQVSRKGVSSGFTARPSLAISRTADDQTHKPHHATQAARPRSAG